MKLPQKKHHLNVFIELKFKYYLQTWNNDKQHVEPRNSTFVVNRKLATLHWKLVYENQRRIEGPVKHL